ncbi:E3 ubiquitin-protein ligase TRIM39-like isoform X2 [Pseudoliparis swirei]|uniref:E3 ubiquitin-protein ligase TRIM39-like isoform X2 n=1 Tax=Pseudoliparis swirei TaxID=2059687 RepID=UPI0024BEB2E7|nr:E3 ubiquitin-protein ligase TRIM39-like isoform X2 [Pseudoliparis swirei]
MTMELPAAFLSEDQFTCSICLDVFNNPVSTSCGHSFCQACISTYWDGGGNGKFYQCPLCKESFRKRPELHINRTLKEITEQFKQMANTEVPMDPNSRLYHHHHLALPPRQRPGEKTETRVQRLSPGFPASHPNDSLPQSPNSEHLDPPSPYSPLRRQSLSSPSDSAPNLSLCPIHSRGLEFFCRTDNTFVCCICVETGEHRGHHVIPAKREWHIKKSQLGIAELELKNLIDVREKKVVEIHNSLREIQAAAKRETDGTVCVFSKLISSLEHCQAEVLKVLRMTRRAAEHRAQDLLRELEEEIAELKKRGSSLSKLDLSEDYMLFLRRFHALSTPPQVKDWSGVSVGSELTSGGILRTVNQVMERFGEEMQILPTACQQSLLDQSVPRPNPRIRRVQEYADGQQVHCGERNQLVPDNPERFDRVVCVLARQGFNSGRHYWEVEVGGKTDWDLGVASQSVNRKGKITVSPAHGYWFLSLRDGTEYSFRTEPSTDLTVSLRPSRIGIYVDYEKGLVSFYNVEARLLIYTFTDHFSDTIHAFFSPCTNKSRRNEAPLIICSVAKTE